VSHGSHEVAISIVGGVYLPRLPLLILLLPMNLDGAGTFFQRKDFSLHHTDEYCTPDQPTERRLCGRADRISAFPIKRERTPMKIFNLAGRKPALSYALRTNFLRFSMSVLHTRAHGNTRHADRATPPGRDLPPTPSLTLEFYPIGLATRIRHISRLFPRLFSAAPRWNSCMPFIPHNP
jgi:hypothetical protein